METMADRLKTLREEAGLTKQTLAEKIGVSRPTIYYWEIGKASPNSENIMTLANFFSCTVEWIIYGIRSEIKNKLDIVASPRHNSKRVPLVDRIPVLEWHEKDINEIRRIRLHKLYKESIPRFDDCSEDSYARQIKNDMMTSNMPNSPSFAIGDYIVIDPHRKPKDGSFVEVEIEGYPEPMFYQYILIGGKPHFRTLNSQYPPQKYSESTKIAGTLVYSYKKYS